MAEPARTRWGRILPALLVAATCGCLSPADPPTPYAQVHGFVHPELCAQSLRRVLVVPFDHDRADPQHADASTEACCIALQSLGLGEVLTARLGEYDLALEEEDPWRGELPIELLVDARRRYSVDSVLLGRVTSYREYGSPALGWQLRLYDASSGRLLWMADDVVDSYLPEVRRALAGFRFQDGAGDAAFHEDASLIPLEAYARFVALSFTVPVDRAVAARSLEERIGSAGGEFPESP